MEKYNKVLISKFLWVLLVMILNTGNVLASSKDSVVVKVNNSTIILYGQNSQDLKEILKYDLNALFADLLKELEGDSTKHKVIYKDVQGVDYRILSDSAATESDTLSVKNFEDKKKFSKKGSPREGFNLYVGLNTYGQDQPGVYNNADYELKPFGSRFIALSATESVKLIKGKRTSLFMDLGLDVAWNNLMFANNNTLFKTPDQVTFAPLLNSDGSEKELMKSKLTIPTVNLSVMPTLVFHRSVISFISAGVYGGYRLGGYTKTKSLDKKKEHVKDNYHLNSFRYGVGIEVGIKKFPDLFFKYDLNELFKTGKAPELQLISFGLRL